MRRNWTRMNRPIQLFQNRMLVYVFSLYVVGLLFGLFLMRGKTYQLTFSSTSFISVFCSNYWYIFLLWLFGFSFVGLFFSSIIVFFRGFLFGTMVTILITNNTNQLGLLTILEILIFVPTFITLSYYSLSLSWNQLVLMFQNHSKTMNLKYYSNLMIIVTILIVFYSIAILMNG